MSSRVREYRKGELIQCGMCAEWTHRSATISIGIPAFGLLSSSALWDEERPLFWKSKLDNQGND